MAAPAWATGATTAGATAASLAVTLPSSIASGDVVVITLYKENTAAVTPPSGFTEKTATGVPPSTDGPQGQYTFWKRMSGGESGTVTFSWTGSVYAAALSQRFTGCKTSGDPIEDINGAGNNTSATASPAVSLSGVSTDTILYWAATDFSGGSTYTPPGGYTEHGDLGDVAAGATLDNTAGGSTGSVSGTANISGKQTAVLLSLLSDTSGAPPSYPTIPTAGAGTLLTTTQADTSATRTFPSLSSLTKNSGDLLIAIVYAYQSTATANAVWSGWGGGFTEFGDFSTTSSLAIGCAYKWSDGTETGTFTVTEAATITGQATMVLMAVPGAHASTPPEAGGYASGTNANADPGSLSPSWGSEADLWIAAGGSGETATTGSFTGMASAPASYGSYADTGISADVVGGLEGAVAFRQLVGSSEDPGAFSSDTSNSRWGAATIAVRPAASGTSATAGVATVAAAATSTAMASTRAAQVATVSAAAANAAVTTGGTTNAPAGVATVAAAAANVSMASARTAGVATVAAAATNASPAVAANAGVAVVAAAAANVSMASARTAGVATVASAASAATAAATVSAGVGVVLATAVQPAVSTSGSANAPAGVATIAVTAPAPVPAVAPNAGVAAVSAAATSTAMASTRTAQVATVSATAPAPTPAVAVNAGVATVAAVAANAAVATSGSANAPAGVATVQAAAPAPTPAIGARAGVAAAAAVAAQPAVSTFTGTNAPAGVATVTAAASAARLAIAADAQAAAVLAVALQTSPSLQNATSSPTVTAVDTSLATVGGAVSVASVAALATSAPSVSDG